MAYINLDTLYAVFYIIMHKIEICIIEIMHCVLCTNWQPYRLMLNSHNNYEL